MSPQFQPPNTFNFPPAGFFRLDTTVDQMAVLNSALSIDDISVSCQQYPYGEVLGLQVATTSLTRVDLIYFPTSQWDQALPDSEQWRPVIFGGVLAENRFWLLDPIPMTFTGEETSTDVNIISKSTSWTTWSTFSVGTGQTLDSGTTTGTPMTTIGSRITPTARSSQSSITLTSKSSTSQNLVTIPSVPSFTVTPRSSTIQGQETTSTSNIVTIPTIPAITGPSITTPSTVLTSRGGQTIENQSPATTQPSTSTGSVPLPDDFTREVALCLLPNQLKVIARNFIYQGPGTSPLNPYYARAQPTNVNFGGNSSVTVFSVDQSPLTIYVVFVAWVTSNGDNLWRYLPSSSEAGYVIPRDNVDGGSDVQTQVQCQSYLAGTQTASNIFGIASVAPNQQTLDAIYFAPFQFPTEGNYDSSNARPTIL